MNHQQIQQIKEKLKNKKLSTHEMKDIATGFLTDTDRSLDTMYVLRDFFIFLVNNYDGNDDELDKIILDILNKKNQHFYGAEILLNDDFFSNITCFNKHSYLFEIYLRHHQYPFASYQIQISAVERVLTSIDDKVQMCNLLMNYKMTTKNELSPNSSLIKFGTIDFLKHLINTHQIANQKSSDIITKHIFIASNFTYHDIANHKYSNEDIQIIIGHIGNGGWNILFDILEGDRLCDKFIFDILLFVILLSHQKYSLIRDIMNKKPMTNSKRFIEVFMNHLKNDYHIPASHNSVILTDIYVKVIEHSKIVCTEEHLIVACRNNIRHMIEHIFNKKILPTQKCYKSLFERNKYLQDTTKIINLFAVYGYKLSIDDILLATKHKIEIDKKYITQKFTSFDDFYKFCDIHFMPAYDDKMYKDVKWIQRMCETASLSKDYTNIKKHVKINGIKMDKVCLDILKKKGNPSIATKELMLLCEHDIKIK